MNRIALFMVSFFIIILANKAILAKPAFPGAEGFGSNTRGAYSGSSIPQILHVTNLNDSGNGSFRQALDTFGPRVIIFDTGGIINLNSNINVNNPYLTIAGQTAPGAGIVLKGGGIDFANIHDVIVRGLRVRPDDGAGHSPCQKRRAFAMGSLWNKIDTLARDIIIDHCSISWTTDEAITLWLRNKNITIQNCIISEPLRDSCGRKGHNYAIMVGPGADHISLHHNIIAHSAYRNPLFGGGGTGGGGEKFPGATKCESINNIVHNGSFGSFEVMKNASYKEGDQIQLISVVGEYHTGGINHPGQHQTFVATTSRVSPNSKLYIHNNINGGRNSANQDDWDVFDYTHNPQTAARVDSWPFTPSEITVNDVFQNFSNLLKMDGNIPRAGAYPRDSTDSRIINEIQNVSGGWINSSSDVGGFPDYSPGVAPKDTDGDGLPDRWETSHGLNMSNPSDAHEDRNGDEYTNLEEYINGIFGTSSGNGSDTSPSSVPALWLLISLDS